MVELDVRDDRDLGAAARTTVRSDSSPSTTSSRRRSPRSSRAAGRARRSARRGRARSRAGRTRSAPRRRPLPVRAGDDDRRRARDELAQELRAGQAGHVGVRGRDDRLPAVGHVRLGRDLDRARRASGSRYGVRTRSQPPTSAPQARASCAYAERPAPPIPTNQSRRPVKRAQREQLVGDLVGRAGLAPRAASPRPSLSRARVVEQRAHESGTRSRSSSRTMIAPPACTKCCAFFAWWSPVANGYGTRIAGGPRPRSPTPSSPSARARGRRVRAAPKPLRLGSTR